MPQNTTCPSLGMFTLCNNRCAVDDHIIHTGAVFAGFCKGCVIWYISCNTGLSSFVQKIANAKQMKHVADALMLGKRIDKDEYHKYQYIHRKLHGCYGLLMKQECL